MMDAVPTRGVGARPGRASRWVRSGLHAGVLAGAAWVAQLGASLALLTAGPAGASKAVAARPLPGGGGALLIGGGGRLPDSVRDRFVELAGGPGARVVVIPTGLAYADGPGVVAVLDPWKARGVASARVLHTRSRGEADDPAFARPLAEATGVWLSGGLQERLAVYAGTEVERQLKALLGRGGVIGGTSAGAAAMTRVMITRGLDDAEIARGLDLLPGAVIDQHFLRRNRAGRLAAALKRHPGLVGLGVDEQTALVVDVRRRRLSVVGHSYVVAFVPEPAAGDGPTRLEFLKPGDEADLDALRNRAGRAVIPALDPDAL